MRKRKIHDAEWDAYDLGELHLNDRVTLGELLKFVEGEYVMDEAEYLIEDIFDDAGSKADRGNNFDWEDGIEEYETSGYDWENFHNLFWIGDVDDLGVVRVPLEFTVTSCDYWTVRKADPDMDHYPYVELPADYDTGMTWAEVLSRISGSWDNYDIKNYARGRYPSPDEDGDDEFDMFNDQFESVHFAKE